MDNYCCSYSHSHSDAGGADGGGVDDGAIWGNPGGGDADGDGRSSDHSHECEYSRRYAGQYLDEENAVVRWS